MRRSAVSTTNDTDNNNKCSSINNDVNNHQHKRSLEDYGFLTNLKRRRHLSPQNSNIDLNNDDSLLSSPSNRKKTRTKSKNRSILNSSIDSSNDHQTPRKSSTRHISSSTSHQIHEITLPNWERICPNIDQILSNKHTQTGVFAHEVQFVQQELEALASMSILRENILKDLLKSSTHTDTIHTKIRQYQQAEHIYSIKKMPPKPLPSSTNTNQSKQNGSHSFLDRQVTLAPILDAKIDRIWSDINTYYYKISSNDISFIENLVKFHSNFKTQLETFKSDYNNQLINPIDLIEKLNNINYFYLNDISQLNPLITHYIERTTLENFQRKITEHIGQTSPVYKTPLSSPMHGKILDNNHSSTNVRISPRLHSSKTNLFSLPLNIKTDDDHNNFDLLKMKKKNKYYTSPSSTVKFQQRLQYVQNYLIDQHPQTVKRQLFNDIKTTKKRKLNLDTNDNCTDINQLKLTKLIDLVDECVLLSNCASERARLQADNEVIWQKLNTIEKDLENFLEKFDTKNKNLNTEKTFQNLAQLLTDWNKYEEEFDQQLEQLFIIDE